MNYVFHFVGNELFQRRGVRVTRALMADKIELYH